MDLKISRRKLLQSSGCLALLSGCKTTQSLLETPSEKSPPPTLESRFIMQTEQVKVNAPFAMPTIQIPDFSQAFVFNILDYGAMQGETQTAKLANNKAIAAAIDAAHRSALKHQQGGIVLIPEGEWYCGPIHLKSYINLHLVEGATLLFSEAPQDYLPAVKTTWEGMECVNYSPLIYAYECEQLAISGKGKLKSKLDVWEIWYKRPEPHMQALAELYHMAAKNVPVEARNMVYEGANLRPHFVQFNRCNQVLIEDIQIENSPFWVLHPFLCKDVVIRRVDVKAHGHNNDGVDPEMTQNMLIEDCVFDQGDDAIAIKAGRNQDAWRLNTPTKNLVMRNCRIKRAHQLVAVGSELSGGVENVLVEHCHFDSATEYEQAGNLLFIKTNERRGGLIKNIHMRHISAGDIAGAPLSIETDVLYQWRTLVPTYEKRLTQIEDIFLTDISAKSADHVSHIEGQAELPVKRVTMKDIRVGKLNKDEIRNTHVEGFTFS